MSNTNKGFTLLELMMAVAVVAILATVAVVGYQDYTHRARAADILVKYDAIKTGVQARLANARGMDDCAQLAGSFDTSNLADPYATLAYGFEAVAGGYRPVLTVCGKADAANPIGAKVAKGAYDTMAKINAVEAGAVVTDSVVSFALPLTDNKQALCKTAVPIPATTCGRAAPADKPVVDAPAGTGSQADCQPHQHFVAGMGCNDVCNPGWYYIPGPPAACSDKPPGAQPPAGVPQQPLGPQQPDKPQLTDKPQQPANPQPMVIPQQPANPQPATGSQQPGNAQQAGSQPSTHQQCVDHCRQTICRNCNSRAYRNCIMACPP